MSTSIAQGEDKLCDVCGKWLSQHRNVATGEFVPCKVDLDTVQKLYLDSTVAKKLVNQAETIQNLEIELTAMRNEILSLRAALSNLNDVVKRYKEIENGNDSKTTSIDT